jgi:RNA polymerase sigma factor (sigma-70 family)
MKPSNELDTLLFTARLLIDHHGETSERIENLEMELEIARKKQRELIADSLSLTDRLRDVAIRAGLLVSRTLSSGLSLDALETLITEKLAQAEFGELPDNVVPFSFQSGIAEAVIDEAEKNDGMLENAEPAEGIKDFRVAVVRILSTLSAREERIIRSIFGISVDIGFPTTGVKLGIETGQVYTQDMVADQLSVSQSTISRCYRRAIRKLKHPSRTRHIRHFQKESSKRYLAKKMVEGDSLMMTVFGVDSSE